MNKFQLQCISTPDLEQMARDIKEELMLRSRSPRIANRLLAIEKKAESNPIASEILIDGLLRPPHLSRRKWGASLRYLPSLISQDWSQIYGPRIGERIFYVYAHVDPSKAVVVLPKKHGGSLGGTPFYIGKGCGDRAFNLKRNQGHGKKISQVIADGFEAIQIVKILFEGLTESEAFEIESKLIFFFGTVYEKSRKFGCLYNLDLPPTPIFVGDMPEIKFNQKD